MATQNWYALLGLPSTATNEEILSAHRRLIRQHHPDKNGHDVDTATQATQLLNEARFVLGDPQKRRLYDLENSWVLHASPPPNNAQQNNAQPTGQNTTNHNFPSNAGCGNNGGRENTAQPSNQYFPSQQFPSSYLFPTNPYHPAHNTPRPTPSAQYEPRYRYGQPPNAPFRSRPSASQPQPVPRNPAPQPQNTSQTPPNSHGFQGFQQSQPSQTSQTFNQWTHNQDSLIRFSENRIILQEREIAQLESNLMFARELLAQERRKLEGLVREREERGREEEERLRRGGGCGGSVFV